MSFTTNIFLIGLLPWFILLFTLLKNKVTWKKVLIFLGNSIFYIWGGTGSFLILCAICLLTWIFCKINRTYKNRILLGLGCVFIVLPLLVFKYLGFVVGNINTLLNNRIALPSLIVPLGISFFTFQAISCLYDVYKGKINESISLPDMYLYLSFFPTVTSGPILRYSTFRDGLTAKSITVSYNDAIERIARGLCKKILIADKVALIADHYFNGLASGNVYSSLGLWVGALAYSVQLYFDFSGYSDMAIGIGALLGFHIPENFNHPYHARSISDFWKRWHISLSLWFRDYIYIPLGGNRCSAARNILNLLVVWLVTGIWHGANWTFIIWGLGYFVLLFAEKYIPGMKKILARPFGHLYTLFFVNLLWVPFRAANVSVAGKFISGMFGFNTAGGIEEKALHFIPYLLLAMLLCLPWKQWLGRWADKQVIKQLKNVLLIILVFFAICAMINSSYTPYIYGSF